MSRMIQLGAEENVWWPIDVPIHRGDGSGKLDKVRIDVRYKRPDAESARAMSDRPEGTTDVEWTELFLERVAEYILDWRGGIENECTPEMVRIALNDPLMQGPLVRGLESVAIGGRAKN